MPPSDFLSPLRERMKVRGNMTSKRILILYHPHLTSPLKGEELINLKIVIFRKNDSD